MIMRIASSIVSLAVVVSLAACGDSAKPAASPAGESSAPVALRFQLNWVPEPEFGGFYAAQADGLYRDAGLAVEIIKDPGGGSVPQLVARGACDLGVVSGDQILQLREQGGELVAVYSVFDHTPYGVMVHAKDAPESLEAVWKGRGNLALESGLPIWKYLASRYGPTTRTVVPYGGGTATFLADPKAASQCFITAEPATMDVQQVPVKVFSASESGYDPYTVVVAVKPGQVPDPVLQKFCVASQEGWKRYLASPAKYNPAIAALNPAMSLEAMNAAAERMRPLLDTPWTRANGLGSMDPARWKAMSDMLLQAGVIKSTPEPASIMRTMGATPTKP
ncbi:MAG: ABC transporter substrate-binding protein [Planctomycetes bacterium]|nr:ABC transporter substrate-binding protein [Planctomycetota bacterium]